MTVKFALGRGSPFLTVIVAPSAKMPPRLSIRFLARSCQKRPRLEPSLLSGRGIEVNRKLVSLPLTLQRQGHGEGRSAVRSAVPVRLFDRDDQELAGAAGLSRLEIPARRGFRENNLDTAIRGQPPSRPSRRFVPIDRHFGVALLRRQAQRHFGFGGGDGGCPLAGGIRLQGWIEGKPSLGFGREAYPGANRIGQGYRQKHGAGGVLGRDMKGKRHAAAVAESLGSLFVEAHWRRIGNRDAGGIH